MQYALLESSDENGEKDRGGNGRQRQAICTATAGSGDVLIWLDRARGWGKSSVWLVGPGSADWAGRRGGLAAQRARPCMLHRVQIWRRVSTAIDSCRRLNETPECTQRRGLAGGRWEG